MAGGKPVVGEEFESLRKQLREAVERRDMEWENAYIDALGFPFATGLTSPIDPAGMRAAIDSLRERLGDPRRTTHRPQEDFVMVFSDETAEKRDPGASDGFVDELRVVANKHGFDVQLWGPGPAVRRAMRLRSGDDSG